MCGGGRGGRVCDLAGYVSDYVTRGHVNSDTG